MESEGSHGIIIQLCANLFNNLQLAVINFWPARWVSNSFYLFLQLFTHGIIIQFRKKINNLHLIVSWDSNSSNIFLELFKFPFSVQFTI